MSVDHRASATGAEWLARMRWGALTIQATAILIATELLGVSLPVAPMWSLVAVGVVSNLWLASRKADAGHLGAFLVLDVALLSGMLYLSGGPTNPFSIIYVVYIAMSAVMLAPAWTWTIAGLSILSFAALFVVHVPSEHLGHAGHGGGFQTHLYGMFIALVLAVALITYFVSQLSVELRRRERALAEAEERTHRWGKLASIATLAAGAAHELGTPLGTIAVAAKEMERQARTLPGGDALVEDAALIRAELERCRRVLDRMASVGGENVGETLSSLPIESMIAEVSERLSPAQAERWVTSTEVESIEAPATALVQMVENIARNGFDACDQGRVSLHVRQLDRAVELCFVDEGQGMDEQAIRRAAEPFFTTKRKADRMGLGLFLARTLVDSLGGRLTIESARERGTTVRVVLPQG
ncbi:MAG: HAMP domain-containing histidine kinase [Myxococcales bacterium]|nr:ATP-binding protein [Deltaproteobacteria bacterium]NND29470.1 HAMP domain-containing histidine kinase [Myxococcales bacterium]MBT8483752.1 ATP-binding protein [Deltaproteobacteria bacterium]NNK43928.1 HAMP domain-containing histidine kinase [Myxococcales bacterium]NNL26610.1 HAMP domain-containing histidine kinase [Myxococcales bacterium]